MINKNRVHLIGIGGSGMISLANLLTELKYSVSGSDIFYNEKFEKLKEKGVKIYLNHNPKNIVDSDFVIYSSAIKSDNVELLEAKRLNKKIYHRVEFLKILTKNKKIIAVSGTHGKTSTTAMLSFAFKHLNLSPSIYFGGENEDFYFGSSFGKGEYFILETDEHDESFLLFDTFLPIVTNIDKDHLDINGPFKGDFNLLKNSFVKFIEKAKGEKAILSFDCPNILEIKDRLNKKILSYSIQEKNVTLFGKITRKEGFSTKGDIYYEDKKIGELSLSIPGEKYFLNALSVILASIEVGLNIKEVLEVLSSFKGVKRRFELKYDNLFTVIDDHADHPTEISVTLKMAKEVFPNRRIILVLEPHRYSRVYNLYKEYPLSFESADLVILLPIDPADEKETFGIDSSVIFKIAKELFPDKTIYNIDKENFLSLLKKILKEKDVIMFLGPGKIKHLVEVFLEDVKRWSFS